MARPPFVMPPSSFEDDEAPSGGSSPRGDNLAPSSRLDFTGAAIHDAQAAGALPGRTQGLARVPPVPRLASPRRAQRVLGLANRLLAPA